MCVCVCVCECEQNRQKESIGKPEWGRLWLRNKCFFPLNFLQSLQIVKITNKKSALVCNVWCIAQGIWETHTHSEWKLQKLRNYRRTPTTGFPQCVFECVCVCMCVCVCEWVTETICYFQSASRLPAYCYWLSAQDRERECERDFEWKMNENEKWMLMGKGAGLWHWVGGGGGRGRGRSRKKSEVISVRGKIRQRVQVLSANLSFSSGGNFHFFPPRFSYFRQTTMKL